MTKRIWLVGGTSESAAIATQLAAAEIDCIVSVTTSAAQNLYPDLPQLNIRVGKLEANQTIVEFCQQENIGAIVDATHPYAVEISQKIIDLLDRLQVAYLRYERPKIETETEGLIRLNSLEQFLSGEYWQSRRVLLTIGVKNLHRFKSLQDQARLYARVLPTVDAIATAEAAGWSGDRLIALRPPFSLELEMALWQHWQIDLVVTKASGIRGGEDIKIQAARQLNIPLIVIERPKIKYPLQTSRLEEIVLFCQKYIY